MSILLLNELRQGSFISIKMYTQQKSSAQVGLRVNSVLTRNDYIKLELMFMKHYAPNRCLYIKVAKLRTGMGSAEMSHLQNRCLKISG